MNIPLCKKQNVLTYGAFNIKGPNGLSVILKAKIDVETGNFVKGELIPIKLLNGGIPEIDSGKEAIKLLQKLTAEDLGISNLIIADSGALSITRKDEESSKITETGLQRGE
jgi:hypothetical protein